MYDYIQMDEMTMSNALYKDGFSSVQFWIHYSVGAPGIVNYAAHHFF